MTLAVDIGNTSIHLGLFKGRRLRRRLSIRTQLARKPAALRRGLSRLARRAKQAVICSVVPWATPTVARALRAAGCPRVRVVGRNLWVPIKNRYRKPGQVGQDRLVGAYAALATYRRDCVIVDFGTAITIDVARTWRHQGSGRGLAGEYLGGVIAPGLDISLEALAARTALLPKVALREPPELLGRDTASSIRSGILHGCAALCDGLVARLKRDYAPRALVVATGGSSDLLAKHARTIDRLRPHLVLEGLLRLSFNT